MSFDMLADEDFRPKRGDWIQEGARLRRIVRNADSLTEQRKQFIKDYAVESGKQKEQGAAKIAPCHSPAPQIFDTARQPIDVALAGLPRYSARLLLTFRLLTPLLTRDDDAFYLFDNPARKDHLLGLPYLSAASLKGLSADAYQRAFPVADWAALGKDDDDPARTLAFRNQDPSAKRLFGIADDGAQTEDHRSQKGRLHFSPVWFDRLQLVVLNPSNPAKAMGTLPIHFEAVAPHAPKKSATLEVRYCNPYGISDSDEATVRADMARWLAAVATWWPVLGLGAKRLAGYGAVVFEKATIQAVGWSGISTLEGPALPSPPAYYEEYLHNGEPWSQEDFDHHLNEKLGQFDKEINELQLQAQGGDAKTRKRVQKALEKAKNRRATCEKELPGQYQKVKSHWEMVVSSQPVQKNLDEKEFSGPDSALELAQWIADGVLSGKQ